MKRTKTNKLAAGLLALACMSLATGCKEDVYDPTMDTGKLPSAEEYFDFKLTGDAQLSVNYDVPGLSTVIEVYDQNPMTEDSKTKKEGINPIYAAYTKDGKYEGKMNIPTHVKEVYVYSKSIATPGCVKLEATGEGFAYDITKSTEVETRGATSSSVPQFTQGIIGAGSSTVPHEVALDALGTEKRNDNLYSITAWNSAGKESLNMSYYTTPPTIGAAKEELGVVTKRLDEYLEAQRKIDGNKSLLRNPKDINLIVPSDATDGMSVNVTYVGENASYFNTFGYYYYKNNGQTLTSEEFYKLKKYVMIPNVDVKAMKAGETVKLLYFDENNVQHDKFPAGYTIGWFVISNGFGSNPPGAGEGGFSRGVIREIPKKHYVAGGNYSANRHTCMSDDTGEDRRFVSLYDNKSKLRVIGIEDGVTHQETPDDYMDVMFFVQTSIDLGAGELPSVGPEEKPEPKPEPWSTSGTVAYEDIWPYGGDYDLNDVIVEYERVITFDKDNFVTHVKETFKPVQKPGSAANDNYFACQYKSPGKLTLPAGVINESATNSIVIEASAKTITGNSVVIERDMSGLGLTQTDVKNDFNPYIIAGAYKTADRVEVHLPMYEMTSAADKSLMNADNAYYISKDKISPFAILIPIAGFIPVDETKRIDGEGQYPSFKRWAESKGKENTDWFLRDKGSK